MQHHPSSTPPIDQLHEALAAILTLPPQNDAQPSEIEMLQPTETRNEGKVSYQVKLPLKHLPETLKLVLNRLEANKVIHVKYHTHRYETIPPYARSDHMYPHGHIQLPNPYVTVDIEPSNLDKVLETLSAYRSTHLDGANTPYVNPSRSQGREI